MTVQLIDARDESHVFSDAFLVVRAREDLAAIKRLSRRTASALAIALGPLDWVFGGMIRSTDPRAIALFRHAEIASRYRTGPILPVCRLDMMSTFFCSPAFRARPAASPPCTRC